MTATTIWRPIPGYEGRYEVSNDGQIKVLAAPGRGRFNEDRILKVGRDSPGYRQVLLYPGEGRKYVARRVHILMLEAFVGPRPEGAFGCHIDDDRDNNHLSNLRWGDRSDNTHDMVRNGRHNHARKTHCKHGHPFAGDNLIVTAKQRLCRACANRRRTDHEARKAADNLEATTDSGTAADVPVCPGAQEVAETYKRRVLGEWPLDAATPVPAFVVGSLVRVGKGKKLWRVAEIWADRPAATLKPVDGYSSTTVELGRLRAVPEGEAA